MKLRNVFLLTLLCLSGFSALHADDQNSNSLVLKLSDANMAHTVVFNQNSIEHDMPTVIFELPIMDNGGSWAYSITGNNGIPALFPFNIDPNEGTVSINDFTNQVEWNSSFKLVCGPCNIGNATVDFYYFDTSHMIVQKCEFKINVVAPATASTSTIK